MNGRRLDWGAIGLLVAAVAVFGFSGWLLVAWPPPVRTASEPVRTPAQESPVASPSETPTPTPTSVTPERVDVEVDGQPAVVLVPPDPNGTMVLFTHGEARTEVDIVKDPLKRDIVERLAAAGYLVAGSLGRGDAWGAPESVTDQAALVDYVEAEYGTTETFMWAQSMGGVASLRAIPEIQPAAWLGTFPVCNLSSITVPRLAASIATANPGGVLDRTAVPGGNVLDGLPMLWTASPEDAAVPKEENSDRCSQQAARAGADSEVVETVGLHDDPSNFDTELVVGFFERVSRS